MRENRRSYGVFLPMDRPAKRGSTAPIAGTAGGKFVSYSARAAARSYSNCSAGLGLSTSAVSSVVSMAAA